MPVISDDSEAKEEEKSYDYQVNTNTKRVEFIKPLVKNIVSHHASSLLASEDPIVALSRELRERAEKIFYSHSTPSDNEDTKEDDGARVSISLLSTMIRNCGLAVSSEGRDTDAEAKETVDNLDDILAKYLPSSSYITLEKFIDIIERFQAPAYNYGQRLRRAAGRGDISRMLDLLVRGCNPNTSDGEGLSPLHYACEFNRIDAIKALWEHSQSQLIINAKCKYGWTPLYTAIHHGSTEAAKFLIEIGADIHFATTLGKTPLHAAAGRCRADMCSLLLEKGARLSAVDMDGMTALHEAAFRGNHLIFDLLSQSASQIELELVDILGNTAGAYLKNNSERF